MLICGDTKINPATAVTVLNSRDLRQFLTEGGPPLPGAITAADLVDGTCLTVSSLLARSGAGQVTTGPPATAVRRLMVTYSILADGMPLPGYAGRKS